MLILSVNLRYQQVWLWRTVHKMCTVSQVIYLLFGDNRWISRHKCSTARPQSGKKYLNYVFIFPLWFSDFEVIYGSMRQPETGGGICLPRKEGQVKIMRKLLTLFTASDFFLVHFSHSRIHKKQLHYDCLQNFNNCKMINWWTKDGKTHRLCGLESKDCTLSQQQVD